jgi:hypothetical protein
MSARFFRVSLFALALPFAVVASVAADPPPQRIADRTLDIKPWETESPSPWGGMRSTQRDLRRYAISSDGKRVASPDSGAWRIEVWDVESGTSLCRFGRLGDKVALAFSLDGKLLVTADSDFNSGCKVVLWDVSAQRQLRQLDDDVNMISIQAAAFSPDGNTLALAAGPTRTQRLDSGRILYLWDTARGREIRAIKGPAFIGEDPSQGRYIEPFDCLSYASNGRSLAFVADNILYLWSLTSGNERCALGRLPPASFARSTLHDAAAGVAFAPDGKSVAVGCTDGAVRLFDIISGREKRPLAAHKGAVRALAYSKDGKTLWSLGADNKVISWPMDAPERRMDPRAGPLLKADLNQLWKDLENPDPAKRFDAAQVLAAVPQQTVTFLQEHLKPAPRVNSTAVQQMIGELKSSDGDIRKRAATGLLALGAAAMPAVRMAYGQRYDAAIGEVLGQLAADFPKNEHFRNMHAVELLALVGNAEARRMLTDLSRGDADAWLTGDANAALKRMDREVARAPQALDRLWEELASSDGRTAFRAMRELANAPVSSVRFLGDRLKAGAAAAPFDDDPDRIAHFIIALNHDEFDVREAASASLKKLGKLAEASLRKALAAGPSPEVRRRLAELLDKIAEKGPLPERLQAEHALEVLEWVGNDHAISALESIARVQRNDSFHREILDALRRLRRE